MTRLTSNAFITLGPVLGVRPGNLFGISDVSLGKHSRLPASRLVRYGAKVQDLPAATPDVDDHGDAAPRGIRAAVASATLNASYRGHDFQVTAWQPEGKPAFVFLVALADRQWIQPDVAEAASFDEVLGNAVAFVEGVLDGDAGQEG